MNRTTQKVWPAGHWEGGLLSDALGVWPRGLRLVKRTAVPKWNQINARMMTIECCLNPIIVVLTRWWVHIVALRHDVARLPEAVDTRWSHRMVTVRIGEVTTGVRLDGWAWWWNLRIWDCKIPMLLTHTLLIASLCSRGPRVDEFADDGVTVDWWCSVTWVLWYCSGGRGCDVRKVD